MPTVPTPSDGPSGPGPSPDQSVAQLRALDLPDDLLRLARESMTLALEIDAKVEELYRQARYLHPATHAAMIVAGQRWTDPDVRDGAECDTFWYLGASPINTLSKRSARLLAAIDEGPMGESLIEAGPLAGEYRDQATALVGILDEVLGGTA